ncbi:MAG TPA: hypothetical protein VGO31_01700 [Microbacteriaceae bacterium]|nr:hypothetical protein [Microbacteriaceae bacterium]
MRGIRPIFLITVTLTSALACVFTGEVAASPQKCVIELRVDVFGTSPGSNWALQGALNAGQPATLRAVARGCGIAQIRGRWINGASTAIPPRPCGGSTTCVLRVRSGRQSAAAFQAFATSTGGATARSNIVRVAWSGNCTAVGTWKQQTDGIGGTTWTIERGGAAQEIGIGNATGVATFSGHVLRITFVGADQVTTGVYTWTLGSNCRTGSGTLTLTGPASRAGEGHASTVERARGG